METNENSKKALVTTLTISLLFSIINYSILLMITIYGFFGPGNRDDTFYVGAIEFILFNCIYIGAMYLEFKAYKTGKISYLSASFFMVPFHIILAVVTMIIKLILLITIAVLIKKNPKENTGIERNNQKELWVIFGLNRFLTVFDYLIILSFNVLGLIKIEYEYIFIAITLGYILLLYLEFKAYKSKKSIYLILPFIMAFVNMWFFISINLIKIILLVHMVSAIKSSSKEHNKILESKQE